MSKKKKDAKKFKKKDLKELKKYLKGINKLEDLAYEFYDKLLDSNIHLESIVKSGKASPDEDIELAILLDEIISLEEKIHKNFEPEKKPKKTKKNKKNKKGGKKK